MDPVENKDQQNAELKNNPGSEPEVNSTSDVDDEIQKQAERANKAGAQPKKGPMLNKPRHTFDSADHFMEQDKKTHKVGSGDEGKESH